MPRLRDSMKWPLRFRNKVVDGGQMYRSGNGVEIQATLMNTPGTMWHLVSNAKGSGCEEDLDALRKWFPDDVRTKHSLKRNESAAEQQPEHECSQLVEEHKRALRRALPQSMATETATALERDGVFYTGPVGDNILHLCYLLKKYKLGRYLVEVFGPRLVNMPYQLRKKDGDDPTIYEGEVVLHIAIVNKNKEEVKFLLEQGSAQVGIRAWGSFFSQTGPCYYGEYPLSFAVCMETPDIIQLLIDKGAEVDAQDSCGNTALHLAVLKSLPRMYWLLADEHKARQDIPNADGLTPLALAAKENNVEMFHRILEYQRTIVWTYGPVICYNIPLEDVDTVQSRVSQQGDKDKGDTNIRSTSPTQHTQDEEAVDGPLIDSNSVQVGDAVSPRTIPALKIIVDLGNAQLLKTPFITKILHKKWDDFSRWIFYAQMLWYAVLMVVVSILVALKRQAADGGITFFDRTKIGCWFVELGLGSELDEATCVSVGATKSVTALDGNPTEVLLEYLCLGLVISTALLELYDAAKWLQVFMAQMQWLDSLKRKVAARRPDQVVIDLTSPASSPRHSVTANAVTSKEGRAMGDWLAFGRIVVQNAFCELKSQANPISLFLYAFIVIMLFHFSVWHKRQADPAYEPWAEYTQDVELALGVVCGWVYVLYFTSGFRVTGPLVVMMLKMIYRDVLKFMAIYVFIAIAFAQALYLLAHDETVEEHTGMVDCNFCSVGDSLLTLFRFTLGDINYDYFTHESASRMMNFVFITWGIVSNILMLNLLIALMNSTYASVDQEAEQIWRRRWARIVLLMERRLPFFLQEKKRLGTEVKQDDGSIKYMHVFEHDSSADPVNGELNEPLEAKLERIEEMLQKVHNLQPNREEMTKKEKQEMENAGKNHSMAAAIPMVKKWKQAKVRRNSGITASAAAQAVRSKFNH
eukprot:jgi/Tetstr1/424538/TSEL_015066.t1